MKLGKICLPLVLIITGCGDVATNEQRVAGSWPQSGDNHLPSTTSSTSADTLPGEGDQSTPTLEAEETEDLVEAEEYEKAEGGDLLPAEVNVESFPNEDFGEEGLKQLV